jgi:hypothetical protein
MLCLSYVFSSSLCLLFKKIGEKGRTGSAWKQELGEGGSGKKWPKQCMHILINELKKIYTFLLSLANTRQSQWGLCAREK